MSLIVAPQAAGLPSVSYLTVAEFYDAPTDVDLSTLVGGGNQQQQDTQLATIIAQASAWMDDTVNYVLGATIDTETTRARVRSDGYVVVPVRGIPILEVLSFSLGPLPSQMQALTSAADGFVQDNTIWMPTIYGSSAAPRTIGPSYGGRVWCRWTYVNGYPNTTLASVATAGATSISVASALGIYPGTSLVVYDSGLTETVQVAATFTPTTAAGPTSVPLVTGLLYDHQTVGRSVSALPPNMKKAAILATTALIKTRGSAGLVMESVSGGTPRMDATEQGGLEDLAMAAELLGRYVLPFYG